MTMEKNGFNNHLSEEKNQPANENGDNIHKEPKVVIFKTSDYDLNFIEREAKYKDYDHILCGKCNQEISKWYFYCKGCCDEETDSNEKNRMKNGKPKVGIFEALHYDLDLDARRAKYKDYYCILCQKCSQEISKWYYYCEDCYDEETDVKKRNRMKHGIYGISKVFKTSNYDLDINERRAKYFKDYDPVLCEKCNQEIGKWYCYCKDCYNKETDDYERLCMKYGRSKIRIFKTSDYDLNINERKAKYFENYYVLCGKCNKEISKEKFYCGDCYHKETDGYERIRMEHGKHERSKVGIFKTSDYDLNINERKAKYFKDHDHVLCEKCNQEINERYCYCEDCYNKETNNHERFCMIYGRSKVGIFKASDYDLNISERKAKYFKDYDHVLCEKCNKEISRKHLHCEDCYQKETDGYERIRMKYGRSKVGIFKTSDYVLNIKEREAKYFKDYDHVFCEKCNQGINRRYCYCKDCYNKETDGYERARMKYGSKVGIFKTSDYDLNIKEREAKYFNDYDHVFCEKCNQGINRRYCYCKDCYNKEIDAYERIHIKYGRSKIGIFKTSDYYLDLDKRIVKYKDYDHVLCEKCSKEINKWCCYCEDCYNKETDHNKKVYVGYGKCKECLTNIHSNGCLPCFNNFLQDFDNWASRNKIVYDDTLKEPKIGISDYDLDEEDRKLKYENYDCILCEKCNQKIYYYCYDCYNGETKELKDILILLQNFYSKLYEEETKELKEIEELLSVLPYKLDYDSEIFMQIFKQLNNIKNQTENQKTRIKNIKYDGHHRSNCTRKLYYYCDCYDKETNGDEKKRMKFGRCKECFQIFEELNDCLTCKPKHFQKNFNKWTSGNKVIDKLIQDNQLLAKRYGLLEWIPYNKFTNIKYIVEGGFAKVYSATWIDGQIKKWSQFSNDWKRGESITVALKVLNDSENISEDFLNELKFFNKVSGYLCVIKCFGITQDPITHNYTLVLQYMENGNLRSYLKQTVNSITWKQRIDKIYDICLALKDIHSHGLIHKDLHPGNIFIDSSFTFIGDFGFCMPANEVSSNSNIYGVMPYMAPEILRKNPYTLASDVYSLGIIINEIITINPPFNNQPHDYLLTLDICRGLRPVIRTEIPKELKELIEKCWDANPEKRPTSKEVFYTLSNHLNAFKNIPLKKLSCDLNELNSTQSSPQAIYTSKLLNFQNLPEPINCSNQQEFIFSRNTVLVQTGDLHSECLECEIKITDSPN